MAQNKNTQKQDASVTEIKNMSLFKLGWPIFVQALLSMCLGYIDTIMISNYSDTAVGGIGNANQIIGFLTLAFSIIASATGVVVAQYLGAKQKDKLNEIYTVSIAFNLILSGVISVLILFGSRFLLGLLKVSDSRLPDATAYMKIVGGFIFLQAIFDTFSQIFRSNGKTKIGMIVAILMNCINIVGNYLFLYGPLKHLDMGVEGVAISTTVSRFAAVIISIFYFIKKIDGTISIKYLIPFPFDILKKLLKIGIPTAGENISYNIAQLIILMFVNTLSDVAIDTKIYANILSNFAYLFSISAAMATSIVVGHSVGANEYDYAYKKVLSTLARSMLVSIAIAIVSFCISPVTFGILTNNQEIIDLGRKIMFICIFLEIGRTANLVIINSMRAAGDVKFPTFLGMASMWGISVLFGYILGIYFDLGLVGIWIAMAMDEIVRGIVVFIRWLRGTWRGKRIVENGGLS
ncbi:MAG: MATE family efflux transporter [Lachnospiraceae bacterium]|nr:MATE family efflux transporter [Lachnospiraceae bacterium]